MLGLPGLEGVGQPNPAGGVAAVEDVAAFAGQGAVKGAEVLSRVLAHLHHALVEQTVDGLVQLGLGVVLGRVVGPALVGLGEGHVAEHVGGVGQQHGLHNLAGPHVVGRALGLGGGRHERDVATGLEIGKIKRIGALRVGEVVLGVAAAVAGAADQVLRDEGRAQGRERLGLRRLRDDVGQQEVRRRGRRVVGVVVDVEEFLAAGEPRHSQKQREAEEIAFH